MSPLYLKNDRLTVTISRPGESYLGSRFDNGGHITQLTLDEKHSFLGEEKTSLGRGTGGCGLISGWLWLDDTIFKQTPVGDFFPIIGVGLLRKPDQERYSFRRDYDFIPFEHTITQDSDYCITIKTFPRPIKGIAVSVKSQSI